MENQQSPSKQDDRFKQILFHIDCNKKSLSYVQSASANCKINLENYINQQETDLAH